MLKKIDRGYEFLKKHRSLFACPICQTSMTVHEKGLTCLNRHRFDLSKKGTLYFLNHQIQTEYDEALFSHRAKLIQGGMYQLLIEQLAPYCEQNTVLDIGCGEGSFLQKIQELVKITTSIGFDISKEGIYLATNHRGPTFWCMADLTRLPFQNQSFDSLLNIFTPSHYEEFQRVLKPGGQLIKVIPGADYLKELRQAFYPDQPEKQAYSNKKVKEKFLNTFPNATSQVVQYVYDIPQELRLSLLEMSPLEWQVSSEIKAYLRENPLKQITIDVEILIGEKS